MTLPTEPLHWTPAAAEAVHARALLILAGAFRGDPAAWPEAWRYAARCVRLHVEDGTVYPG